MQRTRSISVKSIRLYKTILISLLLAYFLLYTGSFILQNEWLGILIGSLFVLLMVYFWYPSFTNNLSRLKDLSYDDENLYIIENDVEEQIPFHEIRDVEIVSLDGIYQFNFFNKQLHGGVIRCKTSMWYPLNFKTVDRELNRVRGLIRKAHWEYQGQIGNDRGLASFN
ncbi:MAG: hypothetical protein GY816_07640 [Cytophagales bacterium]|nr:hypothetical protein [Cytophagales bacterium]